MGLAVVVVLEAWSLVAGLASPAGARWLRQLVSWVGVPACAALVVTGAVATASGPHPGSSDEVERLGVAITETVYVHVRVAAAFGIGVLAVGWFLWKQRESYPGIVRLWGLLLTVLVVLAATIWALSLALAYVLWRPPTPLARQ